MWTRISTWRRRPGAATRLASPPARGERPAPRRRRASRRPRRRIARACESTPRSPRRCRTGASTRPCVACCESAGRSNTEQLFKSSFCFVAWSVQTRHAHSPSDLKPWIGVVCVMRSPPPAPRRSAGVCSDAVPACACRYERLLVRNVLRRQPRSDAV